MSAMMSFFDWLGLLDLFNTPYPNQPYGSRDADFFAQLAEAIDNHNEARFIYLCKHWIRFHYGIQDADQGRKIWNYVNNYLDRWYVNKTGPDVYARFRREIYGDCKGAGESYNNYQPCPPVIGQVYTNLAQFTKALDDERKGKNAKWDNMFANARIKLSDMIERGLPNKLIKYTCITIAERLNCSPALLYSGLHGEF